MSAAKLIIKINREYTVTFVQHTTLAYGEIGGSPPCIVSTSSGRGVVSLTSLPMVCCVTTNIVVPRDGGIYCSLLKKKILKRDSVSNFKID